jgi:hypothetical protein
MYLSVNEPTSPVLVGKAAQAVVNIEQAIALRLVVDCNSNTAGGQS